MIIDYLMSQIQQKRCPVCVGLDTSIAAMPPRFLQRYDQGSLEGIAEALYTYNRELIDALADTVPAVKVQVAYYEMCGVQGMRAFRDTLRYARTCGLVTIADVKRSDIASTAQAYAQAYFGHEQRPASRQIAFDSDMVTLNPYLGEDSLRPFLEQDQKSAIFALVRTSNPSATQLQDLPLQDGRKVYEAVADMLRELGNDYKSMISPYNRVGAVVGATWPEQGALLRKRMPHTFFLVPGYGAQGATAADIAGMFDRSGQGAIVNNSRGIITAWKQSGADFKTAARTALITMRDDINAALAAR